MSDRIISLREQILGVTKEIVKLSAQRVRLARKVGQAKAKAGLPIRDPWVESQLQKEVLAECEREGLDSRVGSRLLNVLMAESMRVQQPSPPQLAAHLRIFIRAKELEAQGKEIIHLEIGEPDFLAPTRVRRALSRAAELGQAKYTEPRGIPELRTALANHLNARYRTDLTEKNLIVTPGGRFATFSAISTLASPGDEVIIIEPAWPAYQEITEYVGARPVIIHTRLEDQWAPPVDRLAEYVTRATKLLVINSPNNPTGRILTRQELQGILELAHDHRITVISDEVYSEYSYKDFHSVLEMGAEDVVYVSSFSKSYGMTGYRIGYIVAVETLIPALSKLQSLAITSVAEPIQRAAIQALSAHKEVSRNRGKMRKRLQAAAAALKKLPVDFVEPDGAFYLFPRVNLPNFDGQEFTLRALEDKLVGVAPGAGFGPYPNFLRISACLNEARVQEGIERLGELLK